MGQRKQYTAGFKARVALGKRSKANEPVQELASSYGVHPNQITNWKKQLVAEAAEIFTRGGVHDNDAVEQEKAELYQQIGKLQVELGLASKKIGDLATLSEKRECIEPQHRKLSIMRGSA